MKKLIKSWLLVSLFFGLTGIAYAEEKPYLRISTTPNKLDLGEINIFDEHETTVKLTVVVESNILHGPVLMSLSNLKLLNNSNIAANNVFVKTPISSNFVSLVKPVQISNTANGSHNIVLYFKVNKVLLSNAGKYQGSLIFTVMPKSPE